MSNYSKAKGRGGSAKNFAGIPRIVMEHQDYIGLSSSARSVLQELAYQYRPGKNGDLTLAYKIMKPRGFKSRTTIDKAVKQLLDARMIIMTRQGYFANPGGVCSLYALTWQPIDECQGKIDHKPTTLPIRKFSLEHIK